MSKHPVPIKQRLEEGLDKSGECWLWMNGKTIGGYGQITERLDTGVYVARTTHRVAYELYVGEIPDGMIVGHKCDTPACCNPDHLFLGTHQDNVTDKVNKDRQAKGEAQGLNVYSEELIRMLKYSPERGSVLSKRYNISQQYISKIRSNKVWKHI